MDPFWPLFMIFKRFFLFFCVFGPFLAIFVIFLLKKAIGKRVGGPPSILTCCDLWTLKNKQKEKTSKNCQLGN
jgi:hypothetical protein